MDEKTSDILKQLDEQAGLSEIDIQKAIQGWPVSVSEDGCVMIDPKDFYVLHEPTEPIEWTIPADWAFNR